MFNVFDRVIKIGGNGFYGTILRSLGNRVYAVSWDDDPFKLKMEHGDCLRSVKDEIEALVASL